jgi:hypothetical protein
MYSDRFQLAWQAAYDRVYTDVVIMEGSPVVTMWRRGPSDVYTAMGTKEYICRNPGVDRHFLLHYEAL